MRAISRSARHPLAALISLSALLLATRAFAQPAFAPPGSGQAGLAVGVDAQGVLRAKACAQQPCTVNGGVDLGVPKDLQSELARAQLAVVGIGQGRRAIVATVPGPRAARSFQAVVVAPLGGGPPRVVFSGLTGLSEGPDGVRQGRTVTIFEPDESGARRIVVGSEREDLDLCGRRAVLAPELLDPTDLRLKPARVQRLTPDERERATRLTASPAPAGAPSGGRVLAAVAATSAVGAPQYLTDGQLETSWVENRGGSGRGEFVVVNAPRDLPIAGFDVVLTAPNAAADPANVPRDLWLTTRGAVYHVTFPDNAAREPGARFRVALPKPERTDCVALVLESAFSERADARVAVAELSVSSEFEGAEPSALVGALAGGGERALAAAAVLRALGGPAYAEISARFESLDERGRRVALDVIDSAPCDVSVPVYIAALGSAIEAQQSHARSRLRRCGAQSAEGLSRALASAKGELMLRFADELTVVAPSRAVAELTVALSRTKPAERRAVRVALARASSAPAAASEVRRLLADTTLAPLATLDLLRALGPRAPAFLPESGAAVARLSADPAFRTRYLLLGPASALSLHHPAAEQFLARALAPQAEPNDSWIRMRAVELAPRDARRTPALVAALSDSNVRVREAAAIALGEGKLASATPELARLIGDDAWPVVRRASAIALGSFPAEPRGNAALLDALSDDSPIVRAAAATSVGARQVREAAPELRDLLEGPRERFEVRRSAAQSLGALCDAESADTLWKLVRRVDDPLSTVEERALGEAALAAVVQLSPAGLDARLAPLRKGQARKAVEGALLRSVGRRCQR